MINTNHFKDFCEYSKISFTFGDAKKYKEGYLWKVKGKRYREEAGYFGRYCGCLKCSCLFSSCCCCNSSRYWFILTSDFIVYLKDKESNVIEEIMLFDTSFNICHEHKYTGESNGIFIKNSYAEIILKAKDEIEQMIWVKTIKEAFRESDWSTKMVKPFGSFAPERLSNYCKEIIDGKDYFEEVYDALKNAKKVVYISDFWMSPKVYLKRPVALDPNLRDQSSRLDVVLKEIADRGVKVYVLLYKEVPFVCPLNSKYAKEVLISLSPNIKVARHPNELISFWSHHEKILIIDNELVLIGGIDLSFGRVDTKEHPLFDYPDENGLVLFPGQDYFNERIKNFEKVDKPDYSHIDRYSQPKLPWHDLAVKLKGPIVKDFIMHFIQYWNHAIININGSLKDGLNFLYPVFCESTETQEVTSKLTKKPISQKVHLLVKVGKCI